MIEIIQNKRRLGREGYIQNNNFEFSPQRSELDKEAILQAQLYSRNPIDQYKESKTESKHAKKYSFSNPE